MITKKKLIILVIIAIILAIFSFILMASDSGEIKTSANLIEDMERAGKIGISIIPSEVEDKLEGQNER